MIGLLLKDIYVLKKYLKQIGFTFIFFMAFTVYLKSPYYLIGMMVMMSTMMIITSMSYDEQVKWDKYALTMPLVRKDIVLSKYLLLILSAAVGTVFSTVIGCIVAAVMKLGGYGSIFLAAGIIFLIAITIFSILIPILFKFGVEKARIIMLVVFAIPFFLVGGTVKLLQQMNVPMPSIETVKMMGFASPVVALIIYFISYNISIAIYEKKEL